MKVYTKTGDAGETSLYGGQRVPKSDTRLEVYGTLDELNACLGLARSYCDNEQLKNFLQKLQNQLFVLGAELASLGQTAPNSLQLLTEADIAELEQKMDDIAGQIPPLTNFILPDGSPASSCLHLARTICRRAERAAVRLNQNQTLRPVVLTYINRLGDLLFMMARQANNLAGYEDVIWSGR